ncbi:hypothetical protein [Falsiroseomonas sp. CW058]|uniref:hypothetical protein n=1 Tax=Falsiroseomonas sp. CW058 TaxID=3388664 RepID=UPI003D322AC8
MDLVEAADAPADPAGNARPRRRGLPAALAVAALAALAAPLLGFTSRPVEPPRQAVPAAGWQGLGPGTDLQEAGIRLAARGFRIVASGLPRLVEVAPAAGPCLAGWASDRACERAVLMLDTGEDGIARIDRMRVEVTLPAAILTADLVEDAARRLGGRPEQLAEDGPEHPRDQPLSRHLWRVPGDLRVELAMPSLPGDAIVRWWMVIDREPGSPPAATLATLR